MLAFESRDIATDVADFKSSGIGMSDALPFTREATLPDGATMTVGFTLAFARDELLPHVGFFAIQHRDAAMFYKSALQQHANGAAGILGAIFVAERPADHRRFFAYVTGAHELRSGPHGLLVKTPRGDIEILDVAAFRDRFGVMRKPGRTGATLEGLRIDAPDLDAVERVLRANDIASNRRGSRLVISPETAFGATLIFEGAHGV
jgi:hypothetical protein